MDHLCCWEMARGKHSSNLDTPCNFTTTNTSLQCKICLKTCKYTGGLTIHVKRTHETPAITFHCKHCPQEFKSENTIINHAKKFRRDQSIRDDEEETRSRKYVTKYKPCPNCHQLKSSSNMAKHVRRCQTANPVYPLHGGEFLR